MRYVTTLWFCHVAVALACAQSPGVRSGPMVGYGEMAETMLWVQTTAPATVQYRYWVEGDRKSAQLSRRISTTEDSDLIAKVVLTNLTPGSRYEYELLLNGKVFARPYRLTFITQAFWQWRSDPPGFTVAFGSCTFINEPESDRPGKPYGGDYGIFAALAGKNPDLMLWLGDNWYYRENDYFAPSRMRYRVARDRAIPELQPLLGSSHHYAIWDDHDYGPNNSDRTYSLRAEALSIFKDYWGNPSHGTVETPGVFFRFLWGDAEFFMLDNRFHRSPNQMPEEGEKRTLGHAQMQWLRESLVSSTARFRVIVGGAQFTEPDYEESMRKFRDEYDELMGWIRSQKIPGVMFLSGDRHFSVLNVSHDEGLYPLYDFTASPLTAGISSNRKAEEQTLAVPGTFVNDTRSFGMLRFEGPRDERQVTFELYDVKGIRRWSHIIKASDLVPPK